ncbi:hypothetical protein ACFVT5_37455 [Streptomyces sp. NPDC058001]
MNSHLVITARDASGVILGLAGDDPALIEAVMQRTVSTAVLRQERQRRG